MAQKNSIAKRFPNEQALPNLQFVLHLHDSQGPIGHLLNIPTGLCTFNGPVYMFPPPKLSFSTYTGFLDSICEDIIFVAFIYNERTPTTIEGEIRLYNVHSQDNKISFQPMNTNQLQMTMTFNRRALFRCVFWSKLREGDVDEKGAKTREYVDLEYARLIQTFAEYKRKQLRIVQPKLVQNLWRSFFKQFLRSDGIFLNIQQHNSKKETAVFPLDLSISALRVHGNAVSVAFITLPQNVGLMRFLERFACHDIRKMVGEFDNVLGVCQGQAIKRNYETSSFQRLCHGNAIHTEGNIYRVRAHTKWRTTLEIEVITNEYFILHHRVKGMRVMKNEMRFCPLKHSGIIFPEGVVPRDFLPDDFEYTDIGGVNAIKANFPKIIMKASKDADPMASPNSKLKKAQVAQRTSHLITIKDKDKIR